MKLHIFLLALLLPISLQAMEYALADAQPRDTQRYTFHVSALMELVNKNNLDLATEWVSGRVINVHEICHICRKSHDENLITLAAQKGHIPLARALLACSVTVHAQNGEPVKKAIQYGHIPMIEFLLSNGARAQDAQAGLARVQRNLSTTQAAEIQEIINEYRLRKCTI